MIEWIDLRRSGREKYMEGKYLCVVVCVALSWLGVITIVAVYLGHNGGLLMSVAGIFGVIIGAVSKTIYEKGKAPEKPL